MEMSDQLHASAALLPGEQPPPPPDNHCIGGGFVSHSRSGRYGDEKNLAPAANRTPVIHPVARRYTD
jgi:hypothetical protein